MKNTYEYNGITHRVWNQPTGDGKVFVRDFQLTFSVRAIVREACKVTAKTTWFGEEKFYCLGSAFTRAAVSDELKKAIGKVDAKYPSGQWLRSDFADITGISSIGYWTKITDSKKITLYATEGFGCTVFEGCMTKAEFTEKYGDLLAE